MKKGGVTIAHFKIEIEGEHDGVIGWSTKFYDDDRLGDADVEYINSIARELETAVKKLHDRKVKLINQRQTETTSSNPCEVLNVSLKDIFPTA